MAVKRLLWHRIPNRNHRDDSPIRRLNNLTMIKLLRIPLVQLKPDRPEYLRQFDKFVLVDGQPVHNDFFSRLHYSAVIDHHPLSAVPDDSFNDIRTEYGSTSTIMTEYLVAARIKPSRPWRLRCSTE